MNYQEQLDILMKSYLDTYCKNKKAIEFIISSQCDQKCEYCYLYKHSHEMNYPQANKKEDVLRNFQLILNYLEKENYEFEDYDIFSGEFFQLSYWEDIFQMIYNFQIKTKKHRYVTIPTNYSFIEDEKLTDKIDKWIIKMREEADAHVHLSCSVDGPEKTESITRPNVHIKQKNQEYYDRLFKFVAKNSFAFHPMVGKYFLQNYKENYDFFIDGIIKHNVMFYGDDYSTYNPPMFLEIRDNDQWDDDSLNNLSLFLNYVADQDLERLYSGDKELYALKFFDDFTDTYQQMTGSLRNQPYILTYPHLSGNVVSCSIQKHLVVRVGDLKMAPCHRTYYSELEYGEFLLNEDKTEIIGVKGINPTLAFKIINFNPARSSLKCGGCDFKSFCIQGCFGSQYENTSEIFAPQEQVCKMLRVKYKTIHDIAERLGLYDIILNHPAVPGERKEFIDYARKILSRTVI